jgi:hypothetical protein
MLLGSILLLLHEIGKARPGQRLLSTGIPRAIIAIAGSCVVMIIALLLKMGILE